MYLGRLVFLLILLFFTTSLSVQAKFLEATGEPITQESPVKKVRLSTDGTWLATADAEGTVRLYEVASRKLVGSAVPAPKLKLPTGPKFPTAEKEKQKELRLAQPLQVRHLDFLPDGKQLLAVYDNHFCTVTVATGEVYTTPLGQPDSEIAQVDVSPDSKGAWLVFEDVVPPLRPNPAKSPAMTYFDLSGNKKRTIPPPPKVSTIGMSRISPDGKTLFVEWRNDRLPNSGRLYDLATMKPLGDVFGFRNDCDDFVFSPDSKLLVVVEEFVSIYEARTGRIHTNRVTSLRPAPRKGEFRGVLFTPDSKSLMVRGNLNDESRVYDIVKKRDLGVFKDPHEDVLRIVHPDGAQVLCAHKSSTYATLRKWSSGEEIATTKNQLGSVKFVGFSGDGKLAYSATDKEVRLWKID